jgi:hypothetical protein
MGKFHIRGKATLTATTFKQVTLYAGEKGKHEYFIHSLNWVLDPTDYSELALAQLPDILIDIQLTSKTQTAFVPLSTVCLFRHKEALTAGGAATTDVEEFLRLPLSGLIQFNTPLMLKNLEALYLGVESIFAGVFSVDMLVSEHKI